MAEKQDYPYQANFKGKNQELINIRATTPDELSHQLNALTNLAEQIEQTAAALLGNRVSSAQAVQNVQQGLGGQVIQQQDDAPPWAAQAPQVPQQRQYDQQQVPPAINPGEMPQDRCVHGARIRREGNGQRGPWVGWFCPTPKDTPGQCKPNFEKRGR